MPGGGGERCQKQRLWGPTAASLLAFPWANSFLPPSLSFPPLWNRNHNAYSVGFPRGSRERTDVYEKNELNNWQSKISMGVSALSKPQERKWGREGQGQGQGGREKRGRGREGRSWEGERERKALHSHGIACWVGEDSRFQVTAKAWETLVRGRGAVPCRGSWRCTVVLAEQVLGPHHSCPYMFPPYLTRARLNCSGSQPIIPPTRCPPPLCSSSFPSCAPISKLRWQLRTFTPIV